MTNLTRRSFLATAATTAGAAAASTALPATAGAQAVVPAAGSTGLQPLDGPGLLGVQAPAGSSDAIGRVRFALPEGLSDWIPFPAADGGREGDTPASGVVASPAGANGFEIEAPGGAAPVFTPTAYAAPAAPLGTEVHGMRQVPGVAQYAALPTVDCYGIPVVPRRAWGCDESISFGALNYRQAQTITVHHSVTPAGWDPAATMRGFHRYHTISNGWGDIGYHLVIDPSGQVYQGHRTHTGYPAFAGPTPPGVRPDSVTAAHVGGNNSGNVGVCLMGNFNNGFPAPGAYAALVNVLAKLTAALGLDPFQGVRYWNPDGGFGRDVQAINGHGDWGGSECPGAQLRATLPQVRQAVAYARNSGTWFPTSAGAPPVILPGSTG